MHTTRQGGARPALFQHTQPNYEQDALRRQTLHQGFWSEEPLTEWQEFLLCRELNCGKAVTR
jgi:hypothetical protein